MNVAELIAFLQTQPPELPVAYRCSSEYMLLSADGIEQKNLCLPRRGDSWVANARPDRPLRTYLAFPGN